MSNVGESICSAAVSKSQTQLVKNETDSNNARKKSNGPALSKSQTIPLPNVFFPLLYSDRSLHQNLQLLRNKSHTGLNISALWSPVFFSRF